jgi:hypothetical protein
MKPDHEQLLKLISKHSINNPVTQLELEKATGINAGQLEQILDNLAYKIPAAIGRCKVIKAGVEIVQIWPSASFERSRCIDPDFNNKRFMPQQPVRRTPAETNHTQETDMANHKKGGFLDIVRFVIDHPDSSSMHVAKVFGGEDKAAVRNTQVKINQCLKNKYLGTDKNGSLVLGTNEIWLAQHGFLDAAAAPKSTPQPPAETVQENTAQPACNPPEEPGPDTFDGHDWEGFAGGCERLQCKPGCTSDLPGGVAENTAGDSNEIQPEAITISQPESITKLAFTVAYFSDQSMELIGLQKEPIILNRDQVRTLLDFIDHICLVTP